MCSEAKTDLLSVVTLPPFPQSAISLGICGVQFNVKLMKATRVCFKRTVVGFIDNLIEFNSMDKLIEIMLIVVMNSVFFISKYELRVKIGTY